MNSNSFVIGRIRGISIGVHPTWLIAFAFFSWILAQRVFPSDFPHWDTQTTWAAAVISTLLLFASVLLHELAHSFVALGRGLPVNSITLFFFGGVSHIGGEAKRARDEFLVSFAGPGASLVIGAGFFFLYQFIRPEELGDRGLAVGVLSMVGEMNLLLGVFNLLPGFPLDGGRVLRSIVWGVTGRTTWANRVAGFSGRIIAFLLIGLGIFLMFQGDLLSGIWMIFIGLFLNGAAGSETRRDEAAGRARNLRVVDLMHRQIPLATSAMHLDQVVREVFVARGVRAAPVVDDGRLAGIITMSDAQRMDQRIWPTITVASAMTTWPLHTISPLESLDRAADMLLEHDVSQLIVVHEGQVVGMIWRDMLAPLFRVREEMRGRREGTP